MNIIHSTKLFHLKRHRRLYEEILYLTTLGCGAPGVDDHISRGVCQIHPHSEGHFPPSGVPLLQSSTIGITHLPTSAPAMARRGLIIYPAADLILYHLVQRGICKDVRPFCRQCHHSQLEDMRYAQDGSSSHHTIWLPPETLRGPLPPLMDILLCRTRGSPSHKQGISWHIAGWS